MAAITQTVALGAVGAVDVTRTTLTASDTLSYTQGGRQILFLYNTGATAITVTLKGSASTSVSPAGYGGTVDVSAGKAITVPANGSTLVDLDDIWAFLKGNVTVTGGTGLVAHLFV